MERKKISTLILLSICIGATMAALVVGLWPLDFDPPNRVQWGKDCPGLEFRGSQDRKDCRGGGIVRSVGPLLKNGGTSGINGMGVAIELWLKPLGEPGRCRSRILSFYDLSDKEELFIGQWRSHLLVRGIFKNKNGENVFREIGVKNALISKKKKIITICSGNDGIILYVDGKAKRKYPNIRLFKSAKRLSELYVCIGNSINATASWEGYVLGFALYQEFLTSQQVKENIRWWKEGGQETVTVRNILALYRFNEGCGYLCRSAVPGGADFLISDKFPLKKQLLKTSNPLDHPIKDLMINFFGFVPIGFIFCMLLKCRKDKPVSAPAAAAIAVAAAMVLSFCIEWAQVYLPTRDSSLTDLSINTAGAIAGAVLCAWRCKRLPFIRC